jgi:exonuclease III
VLDAWKSNNFKILHHIIRGITHKIEEFFISLSPTNPQVLCLVKHHLRPEEIDNIHLGQYILGAYFCRRIRKQGGVSIIVSNDIQLYVIDLNQYVKEKYFEICALKLQVSLTSLLVICFYRSPMGDFTYFLNQLELILHKLYKIYTNIILCGDFNPLNSKRRLFYLKTQFVPRNKHFASRL